MGAGLSLDEQGETFLQAGIEPRVGAFWSGRLEEWLATVLPVGAGERYGPIRSKDEEPDEEPEDGPGDDESIDEWTERRRKGVQTWSFPTDGLRDEYLRSIQDRSEADVFALLRLFLFEESCFGGDSEYLHQALYVHNDFSQLNSLPTEFRRRLTRWMVGNSRPHPSVRWTLDLLPHSPQQAIDAIKAYLNVYRAIRPQGRSQGLLDAAAVIRARWIDDLIQGTEALFRLSPRDLEKLVAALYRKLGYDVRLTPPSRDGGRDVIAIRREPGRRELVEIECKAYSSPVGVKLVRQLRGVVETSSANRGILVTTGRFTKGSREEASKSSRIELVDGPTLIQLLNSHFGPLWIEDQEWICRGLA